MKVVVVVSTTAAGTGLHLSGMRYYEEGRRRRRRVGRDVHRHGGGGMIRTSIGCTPVPEFQHDGLPLAVARARRVGAGPGAPPADGGRRRRDGGGPRKRRRSDPPHAVPAPGASHPHSSPGDRTGEGGGAAGVVVVRGHQFGHGGRRGGICRGEAVRGNDDSAGGHRWWRPGTEGMEEAGGRRTADGAGLAAAGGGGSGGKSGAGRHRHGSRSRRGAGRRQALRRRVVDAVVDAGRRRRDGQGNTASRSQGNSHGDAAGGK